MAKPPKPPAQTPAPGLEPLGGAAPADKEAPVAMAADGEPPMAAVKATLQRWFAVRGAKPIEDGPQDRAPMPQDRLPTDEWEGWQSIDKSAMSLLGTEQRGIRPRETIYRTWQDMTADPVIGQALRLHVTAALGGHESRGEMIFIEAADAIKGNAELEALVAEVAASVRPILNRIAPQVSFLATQFGDSYGRIYGEKGVGVRDVYTDEMVYPPLIQPYERGNTTIGYVVSGGRLMQERLDVMQMARMRMPRMMYVPQDRISWKLWRTALKTDKLDDLPALPALAGGSFLDGAEKAYHVFAQSWAGLTGARVRDSIRQTFVTVQQQGMSKRQRSILVKSIQDAFATTNSYISSLVSAGKAVLTEIFHFLPVWGDKQMVTLTDKGSSASTGSAYTIEDVMMNARLLAGALGMDLSMLGFADQLAGGLGEGGFFRTSAQTAERSRIIRQAFTEFANHVIAVHVWLKYGMDFGRDQLPWKVEFFGGISAMETEKARTTADKMNSTALAVQTFAQMKELGLDKEAMESLMTNMMGLDEAQAKLLAAAMEKAIKSAAAQAKAEAAGMGGGGGFGEDLGPQGPGDEGIQPAEG